MGRKKLIEKKQQVAISIEPSKIRAFGGKEPLQEFMFFSASEMANKLNNLKNSKLRVSNKKIVK